MHKNEFCEKMIGKPWAYRESSFETVDCWGLVIIYFNFVLGVSIKQTDGYDKEKEFSDCHHENIVFWENIDNPEENCIFVCFVGDKPSHVGLIINGHALHASQESGCVRYDKLRAINRKFTKVEFLRYADN